ncbi:MULTISPECIES: CaiB/BaiF CoA transferase family protein [Cupriavidus]
MPTNQPLSGYTIVEIGHSVAAPYTGLILANLGATVIKVENPGAGDHARGWGPPFFDEAGPHFVAMNRNKRSAAIDLADATQREALRRLILEEADGVICNLRAGVADQFGVGPASLLEENPALVYCEIGAFGSGGPMSHKPGYDPLMQAYGGMMSITGESAERPPIRVGVSIIDMGAGLWGAVGMLSALLERERTGLGGLVETSLFETALAWTTVPLTRALMHGGPQLPQGSGAAGIVPYQAFRTQDGWLVIGAGNDKLFAKLTGALDLPGLADDERFRTNRGRVQNKAVLIPMLEARASAYTNASLGALLDAHGVPNAPVQTIEQIVDDPQTRALGMIQDGPEGSMPTVGLPLRFDGRRSAYHSAAPRLGAHTGEVLDAPAGDRDISKETSKDKDREDRA